MGLRVVREKSTGGDCRAKTRRAANKIVTIYNNGGHLAEKSLHIRRRRRRMGEDTNGGAKESQKQKARGERAGRTYERGNLKRTEGQKKQGSGEAETGRTESAKRRSKRSSELECKRERWDKKTTGRQEKTDKVYAG